MPDSSTGRPAKPNIPVGEPPARTATEVQDLQDHTTKVMVDEFNKPPPPDGSELPPITGDAKITVPADGMATAEQADPTVEVGQAPDGRDLPPITGGMAVTEKPDMMIRGKSATKR